MILKANKQEWKNQKVDLFTFFVRLNMDCSKSYRMFAVGNKNVFDNDLVAISCINMFVVKSQGRL